jgi:hypothetical protein
MTDLDWPKIAREVLATVDTPTLATAAKDGTVRAVIVGGEIADGMFHWRSFPSRVHSRQVLENPQISFNFFDSATRREVYGTAKVEKTDAEDGGWVRYFARISELWVVDGNPVDGNYIEPHQLELGEL